MSGLKLPGPMLCGRLTVSTNWFGWVPGCMGSCAGSPSVAPDSVAAVAFPPAVRALHDTTNVVAVPGADGVGVTLTFGLSMSADRLSSTRAALARAHPAGHAYAALPYPAPT